MVEADQPQAPVDNALKFLVHNATQEFGFAPRDVYHGVLDLPETREKHAIEVEGFNCSKLKTLVETFTGRGELSNTSQLVVAMRPYEGPRKIDRWQITFKLPRITRRVMEVMQSEEDRHLWEMFNLLRNIRDAST